MTSRLIGGLAAALSLLLGACTVGPDFVPPAPPAVEGYGAPALPTPAEGREPPQRIVDGAAIPAAWWQLFRSPSLDRVVRETIANSPTVEAARHALAQAEQAVVQVRGGYFPQVDLAATAQRNQGPTLALGLSPAARHGLPVYNLYSLGPVVSFVPDVFGLTARREEQQAAGAELRAYQLAAAQLGVTGNAVATAITIAALRNELAVVDDIVASDERTLALVRARQEAGRVAMADVLAAESQLANDQALSAPLRQQLAVAEDALAVLAGRFPAQSAAPDFELAGFAMPAELPASIPSALVRQRPDLLAVEARLHASSAAVGVAAAQRYPNIALSASLATVALTPDALFGPASGAWALAGGLTAPVFHGGALAAQEEGALEGFRADEALYRQTVLQAFGQVADLMKALGNDARLAEAERRAADSADASLELQRLAYDAGRADLLRLLDAQRSRGQARLGYVRAQAQRYLDSAALLVAMGGGWWEDPDLFRQCPVRPTDQARQ